MGTSGIRGGRVENGYVSTYPLMHAGRVWRPEAHSSLAWVIPVVEPTGLP